MVEIVPLELLGIHTIIHFIVTQIRINGNDTPYQRSNRNKQYRFFVIGQISLVEGEKKISQVVPAKNQADDNQFQKIKIHLYFFQQQV